jgi:hypothetical protein
MLNVNGLSLERVTAILVSVIGLSMGGLTCPSVVQAQVPEQPPAVDCGLLHRTDIVLPRGVATNIANYCHTQVEARLEQRDQQSWSEPYLENGSICRDRNIDTVCVTPAAAANLRWGMRDQ